MKQASLLQFLFVLLLGACGPVPTVAPTVVPTTTATATSTQTPEPTATTTPTHIPEPPPTPVLHRYRYEFQIIPNLYSLLQQAEGQLSLDNSLYIHLTYLDNFSLFAGEGHYRLMFSPLAKPTAWLFGPLSSDILAVSVGFHCKPQGSRWTFSSIVIGCPLSSSPLHVKTS